MKYMGSKSRIAKELVPIIQEYVNSPSCSGYVEPFCGGCNIIDKVVHANKAGYDAQKYLIALLEQAKLDCTVFPETVDKETYRDVRENMEPKYDNWFIGLVGFCASYNGKWFGGYANGVKTKIGTIRNYTDESIRNLVKQSEKLKDINFYCQDFRCLKDLHGCVIYCDPPYRDTTNYSTEEFPYEEFYDWCRIMSKENVVLISEYNMPDDFKCIWSKELTTTLDKSSRSKSIEKLFIFKG